MEWSPRHATAAVGPRRRPRNLGVSVLQDTRRTRPTARRRTFPERPAARTWRIHGTRRNGCGCGLHWAGVPQSRGCAFGWEARITIACVRDVGRFTDNPHGGLYLYTSCRDWMDWGLPTTAGPLRPGAMPTIHRRPPSMHECPGRRGDSPGHFFFARRSRGRLPRLPGRK